MSGYVKAFNIKDGNEDKKLTFFPINDEKLLEKYKAIWTKIEDFKNIKLNGLPLYANRHKETKIKHMVITILLLFSVYMRQKLVQDVNLFTIIPINSLLAYENLSRQNISRRFCL